MTTNIDMTILRDVLAGAETMVAYYSKGEEKIRQNEALKAAGLKPMHSESSLQWDVDQAAKKRREAECLRAVIAFLEGESARAEAA